MNCEKLVSVIIPVFNVEKYIFKCLESIICQTYKNLEIIIVNDGSEENEDVIIKKYMKLDSRIRYIRKKTNEGLFKARIDGVKAATGYYIQFVDGDDYINQDFIRLLVEKAESENADIVFGRTVTCTPKGSNTIYIFQDTQLYQLPLEGDDLKRAFYEQHGTAYIWHTVWNKIYKRELWNGCICYFEKMNSHLVMTEDIAFSSILFYYAKKATCSRNAVYFYCQHVDASTNSLGMTIEQYQKKISDVYKVFEFLRDFFGDKEEWIQGYIEDFRAYYARMWYRIAEGMSKTDCVKAMELCHKLLPKGEKKITSLDDNYFTYMEVPYSDELDKVKKIVYEGTQDIISFDVFDTVVSRPFYHPTDLFYLLDSLYEKFLCSNVSFHTIRVQGEQGCREKLCNNEKEDVTLEEIYDYITEIYSIPKKVCNEIMEYEKKLEILFSTRRDTAFELYKLAKLSGKRIVFTSDMYLPKDTIKKILIKNGYTEFEDIYVSSEYSKLKKTGHLYKIVLDNLEIKSEQILHIGDSIEGDVNAAIRNGMNAIHFPKALDVFLGRNERLKNGHRAFMGKEVSGMYQGNKSFEKCLSYGCTLGMAANLYFDNPFVGFNDNTDFNVDAFFAGYYVLGTNLIAQITWIDRVILKNKLKRIIFTSRDGYLLMQGYIKYLQITHKTMPVEYMNVSRRSMMPWMLKDKTDFMDLPIVYQKYSPRTIEELLSFCIDCNNNFEWKEFLQREGIDEDKEFSDTSEYQRFMKFFLEKRYSLHAHTIERNKISEYCKSVKNDDGIFDLGYSASIHRAIADASNASPTALFIHTDLEKHGMHSRRGDFSIESMMDTIPNISGLMREFFFSDASGSCVGYKLDKGKVTPVLEDEKKYYTDIFPLKMMQKGALQMVEDFYKIFNDFLPYIEVRIDEMQLPFEAFLVAPSKLDTKIFISSYFEDRLYGKIDRINVRDFWLQLLMGQPGYRNEDITNSFDEFLKKHKKARLAFFGTGKMCEALLEENPQIPVDIYLDNNRAKAGSEYHGKKIINPYDYPDLKELYIVVTIGAYKQVEEQLHEMGLIKYDDYLNYLELF